MIARVLPQGARLAVIVTLLLGLSNAATGKEYYRWKDDAGVTHYSTHPPKDRQATKVRATNTQIEVRDNSSATIAGTAADSDDESADDESAALEAGAAPAVDPKRCEAARKNIRTLQEKSRIRIKENGEYRFLTPEEMEQKLLISQQIVDEEC